MGSLKRHIKLFLLCLLLSGAAFSLAAQTNRAASVYMPPVTGTGIDQRDNAYFFIQIYQGLSAQDFITMGDNTAEFSLVGVISPGWTNEATSSVEYSFNLNLRYNRTGQIVSEQRYRYVNLENADLAIKLMVENVLSAIQSVPRSQASPQPVQPVQPAPQPAQPATAQPSPQPVEPAPQPVEPAPQTVEALPETAQPAQQPAQPVTPTNGEWRDRWLFLGFSVFWNPRIYMGETPVINLRNLGVMFYPEFQVLDSVSLEMGLGLAPEWVRVTADDEFRDLMLEIPLFVKIVLKPDSHYMLEPYSGVCFNFSLFNLTRPSMVSWVAGYQHGVKAGQGAFLFDFRFAMDLSKSSLVKYPEIYYQRYSISFGIGYKHGVMPK